MQQAIRSPIDDSLAGAREVAERLGARLRAAFRGRDEVVELVLVAFSLKGQAPVALSDANVLPRFGFDVVVQIQSIGLDLARC